MFKTGSKIVVAVLVTACFISMEGCVSQTTLASLAGVLGTDAANLAAIEGNPTLSVKLKADTAVAVLNITNWTKGSPVTEIDESLNIVEDDLNLFPTTGAYLPLIDLAIGTVESILAFIPQPATSVASPLVLAHTAVQHRIVHLSKTPKTAAEFQKQWNATQLSIQIVK